MLSYYILCHITCWYLSEGLYPATVKLDHVLFVYRGFHPGLLDEKNLSTKTFFVYTIEINMYWFLEGHFTSISPSRTFTDGENIELQCAVGGFKTSYSTVEFICHGQRVSHNLESSVGAVTLNITIDVDYNGTKCVCTAVDGNSTVKTEIDLDIIQCEY